MSSNRPGLRFLSCYKITGRKPYLISQSAENERKDPKGFNYFVFLFMYFVVFLSANNKKVEMFLQNQKDKCNSQLKIYSYFSKWTCIILFRKEIVFVDFLRFKLNRLKCLFTLKAKWTKIINISSAYRIFFTSYNCTHDRKVICRKNWFIHIHMYILICWWRMTVKGIWWVRSWSAERALWLAIDSRGSNRKFGNVALIFRSTAVRRDVFISPFV